MDDNAWNSIVEKACGDADFKKRLLADPKTVLTEEGVAIPEGITIRVVNSDRNVARSALPSGALEIFKSLRCCERGGWCRGPWLRS